MEKTYELLLGPGTDGIPNPPYTPSHLIRHADCQYWTVAEGCVFEQCFDGRYAYLYYYEYWLDRATDIPVQINKGDLHLLYTLRSDGEIHVVAQSLQTNLHTQSGEGAYYYLSQGTYNLRIPPGHHILIGFILDAGLFRPPANKSFTFLDSLLKAKKDQAPNALQSKRFRAGELTTRYLQLLFKKINPYTLDNEHILLRHLIFLINLSRFKFLDQAERQNDERTLVYQARQLLELLIIQQGAQAQLKDIAQVLHIGVVQLRRLHRHQYGYSLQQYRNELLLDLIRSSLPENDKLIATAIQVGFSGLSEMGRFIRTHTGLSSQQFKAQIKNKKINLP